MAQVLDSLEMQYHYTKSGLVRQELGNILSTQSWVDNIPRFADYWDLT
jgi:hypothetical protein